MPTKPKTEPKVMLVLTRAQVKMLIDAMNSLLLTLGERALRDKLIALEKSFDSPKT